MRCLRGRDRGSRLSIKPVRGPTVQHFSLYVLRIVAVERRAHGQAVVPVVRRKAVMHNLVGLACDFLARLQECNQGLVASELKGMSALIGWQRVANAQTSSAVLAASMSSFKTMILGMTAPNFDFSKT